MDTELNTKYLKEFVFENKVPDSSTYDYKSLNEAMSEYKEEENEYNERHNINPKDYENIHYEDNYISTPSKSDNKNNLNQNNSGSQNSSTGGNSTGKLTRSN